MVIRSLIHIVTILSSIFVLLSGCGGSVYEKETLDYDFKPINSYSNFKDFRKFYFDTKDDVEQNYSDTLSLNKFIDTRYNSKNNIDSFGNMYVESTNKKLNYAGSQSAIIVKPNFKPFEQNNTLYIKVVAENIQSNGNGEFAIWAYFINSKGNQFSMVITIKPFGYALNRESGLHLDTSTNIKYFGTILNNTATLIDYNIENNVYTIIIKKNKLGIENIEDYKVSLIGLAGELGNTPKTFMSAKIDWLEFGITNKK